MTYIKGRKLNNNGAALIMVIVAMLFAGIIASTVLSLATSNAVTVSKIRNNTDTFYSAEEVVDEFRTRLSEYADEAMRYTYTKWLQTYSTFGADQLEDSFKQIYYRELTSILKTNIVRPLLTMNPQTAVENVLYTNAGSNVSLQLLGNVLITPMGEDDYSQIFDTDGEGRLVLKGVKIGFSNTANSTTYITTDMIFDVKYPGFKAETVVGTELGCLKYCLITDKTVEVQNGTGGINGNVYAGEGFNISNADTDFEIGAKTIVSGGSFNIADGANVNIFGGSPGAYSELWTRNIHLFSSTKGAASNPKLNVRGNCYVEDDLTLDANRAEFVLDGANSGYYGYSSSNADKVTSYDSYKGDLALWAGTADGSSAIIVNGNSVKLDLAEADTVWIAGKAFISVPTVFGSELDPRSTRVYIEGESISYRGQQSAYLVPGDCIIGIGHNPMTAAEYQRILQDERDYKAGLISERQYYISMGVSPTVGDLRIEDYLVRSDPYRVAVVQYVSGGEDMYFLYLNFQNADMAAEYFRHYSTLMDKLVDSRMQSFTGEILVDKDKLVTTGNVLSYDSENGLKVIENNRSRNEIDVIDKEFSLQAGFKGLLGALDKEYVGLGNEGVMASSLVNWRKLDIITASKIPLANLSPNSFGVTEYCLYTGTLNARGTRDVVINENSAGIILASGDVTINGATFSGTIIAKGKIILKGSARIASDADRINAIVQAETQIPLYVDYDSSDITVDELFVPNVVGSKIVLEGTGHAADLIKIDYRNWVKNE